MKANSQSAPSSGDVPPVETHVWAMPKRGESMDAYEDAAFLRTDTWPVRAAVADGATESVFARAWAKRLVHGLVERGTVPKSLRAAVPDWQEAWQGAVRERTRGRPWYVEAKAAEGAFATLLGVSIHGDGHWRAVGVGDCCLFQVRAGRLLQSWPFEKGDVFTNRPALVPSDPARGMPTIRGTSGAWSRGDIFLLATDAVAAWLLHSSSSARPGVIGEWDEDQFRHAVDRARAAETLRNDDATLLVIHVKKTRRDE